MFRIIISALLFAIPMASSLACEEGDTGFTVSGTDSDSDGDSDSDSDGDSDSDSDGDSDSDNDGDSDSDNDTDTDTDSDTDVCAEQEFKIEAVPARVIIAQDISSSMVEDDTPTKWDQAKAALVAMLKKYNDRLAFAFDVFPNNGSCGVAAPVTLDYTPGNWQQITQWLQSHTPYGSTPLHCELNIMAEPDYAPLFKEGEASRYLIVVSDGGDTCGPKCGGFGTSTPKQMGTATAALLDLGIQTMVIGFGAGVEPAQLNAIAQNGGTQFTTYFNAQNQAELEQALDTIGSSVVSCIFAIDKTHLDTDQVDMDDTNFYFDGTVVYRDDDCAKGVGWTWTDNNYTAVEFCKEACDKLKSGDIDKVNAKFGCPSIYVP